MVWNTPGPSQGRFFFFWFVGRKITGSSCLVVRPVDMQCTSICCDNIDRYGQLQVEISGECGKPNAINLPDLGMVIQPSTYQTGDDLRCKWQVNPKKAQDSQSLWRALRVHLGVAAWWGRPEMAQLILDQFLPVLSQRKNVKKNGDFSSSQLFSP
jgi:hypothetical protein